MCAWRGSPAGTQRILSSPPASSRHVEHADRADAHQAAGERRLLQQHQGVERVAVLAEAVLDVAVVGGVAGGGEQQPVEPDPSGLVVDLVLVAVPLRDLDGDVELHDAVPVRWCRAAL